MPRDITPIPSRIYWPEGQVYFEVIRCDILFLDLIHFHKYFNGIKFKRINFDILFYNGFSLFLTALKSIQVIEKLFLDTAIKYINIEVIMFFLQFPKAIKTFCSDFGNFTQLFGKLFIKSIHWLVEFICLINFPL